jgi:hypothetical protein
MKTKLIIAIGLVLLAGIVGNFNYLKGFLPKTKDGTTEVERVINLNPSAGYRVDFPKPKSHMKVSVGVMRTDFGSMPIGISTTEADIRARDKTLESVETLQEKYEKEMKMLKVELKRIKEQEAQIDRLKLLLAQKELLK